MCHFPLTMTTPVGMRWNEHTVSPAAASQLAAAPQLPLWLSSATPSWSQPQQSPRRPTAVSYYEHPSGVIADAREDFYDYGEYSSSSGDDDHDEEGRTV